MNIDFKSRLTNKAFWITLIPAIILVVQVSLATLDIDFDFGNLGTNLLMLVNAVFALLTVLGIAVDTSTDGFSDVQEEIEELTEKAEEL